MDLFWLFEYCLFVDRVRYTIEYLLTPGRSWFMFCRKKIVSVVFLRSVVKRRTISSIREKRCDKRKKSQKCFGVSSNKDGLLQLQNMSSSALTSITDRVWWHQKRSTRSKHEGKFVLPLHAFGFSNRSTSISFTSCTDRLACKESNPCPIAHSYLRCDPILRTSEWRRDRFRRRRWNEIAQGVRCKATVRVPSSIESQRSCRAKSSSTRSKHSTTVGNQWTIDHQSMPRKLQ